MESQFHFPHMIIDFLTRRWFRTPSVSARGAAIITHWSSGWWLPKWTPLQNESGVSVGEINVINSAGNRNTFASLWGNIEFESCNSMEEFFALEDSYRTGTRSGVCRNPLPWNSRAGRRWRVGVERLCTRFHRQSGHLDSEWVKTHALFLPRKKENWSFSNPIPSW